MKIYVDELISCSSLIKKKKKQVAFQLSDLDEIIKMLS